jgi:DNA modification methylase
MPENAFHRLGFNVPLVYKPVAEPVTKEKSIDALLPLLESFSQEGSVILDPFCGSGSTLLAECNENTSLMQSPSKG